MLHLHSLLRWVVLILLVVAFVKSVSGLVQKKDYTKGDGKIGLYLMIFAHIQLLIGLALYFMNGWAVLPMADAMSEPTTRFWKVEHITAMILGIVFITI